MNAPLKSSPAVLIVEDDPMMQLGLEQSLQAPNRNRWAAEDGGYQKQPLN